jgi:hypothetical protein
MVKKNVMKNFRWQVAAGGALLCISCFLYALHYLIFHDMHHILIFMIGEFAFLPAEVLVVTFIIDRMLKAREKKAMLTKLNMVIGIFFSKVGIGLLQHLSIFDRDTASHRDYLIFTNDWDRKAFGNAVAMIKKVPRNINSRNGDLENLRHFLNDEKDFLLTLLGNPNLLEHENFTDLLWAVTHLSEELALREDLDKLSEADYNHISIDITRAYVLLLTEWLTYMGHLKNNYPHLFSLAVRINPFDPNASAEIR